MAYKHPIATMRKFIILFLLGVFPCSLFAQKIKKKEIDKFTKAEVVETSVETLYDSFSGYEFKFCIRKVNSAYEMSANIRMEDIVKYTEGDGVTFLLDDEDIVNLETNFTGIGGEIVGEIFGSKYWFRTSFILTDRDVEKLKSHKVVSIRIRYLGGHYDRDIKKNKQDLISKSLLLLD